MLEMSIYNQKPRMTKKNYFTYICIIDAYIDLYITLKTI